nr:hypothetical protein [Tanacetum cinerariifolium]
MSICNSWEKVVNRVRNKLSAWKAKSFSIGGRLTLIKYVLDSIPIYYLSFSKLRSRLLTSLNPYVLDPWVNGGTRLKDLYPRLFALDSCQDCTICEKWCLNGSWSGMWSWRCPPRGRAINDVSSIFSLISNLSISGEGADNWVWSREALGIFKVNSLSLHLHELLLADHSLGSYQIWNSWISRKVNICIWRASINRLHTRSNLLLRGVNIGSDACPFCEVVSEYVDHSLLLCPSIKPIWRKTWSWWNLDMPVSFPSFDLSDICLSRDPDRPGSVSYPVLDRTNWIAIRGYCSELCDYGPPPVTLHLLGEIWLHGEARNKRWSKGRVPRLNFEEWYMLHCGNQAAVKIANKLVQNDRTKHVEIDRHFIKDHLEKKSVELSYVASKDQLADMLTKAVCGRVFQCSLGKLRMIYDVVVFAT